MGFQYTPVLSMATAACCFDPISKRQKITGHGAKRFYLLSFRGDDACRNTFLVDIQATAAFIDDIQNNDPFRGYYSASGAVILK